MFLDFLCKIERPQVDIKCSYKFIRSDKCDPIAIIPYRMWSFEINCTFIYVLLYLRKLRSLLSLYLWQYPLLSWHSSLRSWFPLRYDSLAFSPLLLIRWNDYFYFCRSLNSPLVFMTRITYFHFLSLATGFSSSRFTIINDLYLIRTTHTYQG